jgi:probable rRNA maturation factor
MQKKKTGIIVDILRECEPFEVDWAGLETLVARTLRQFHVRRAQVSICVTDDKGISRVNRKYLGHKGSTDVISFDLSEEKGPRVIDLVVNAELAARQAHNRGHAGEAELTLYVVHGLLHCLGFDDLKKTGARRMHIMEDDILRKHGYGEIYGCQ